MGVNTLGIDTKTVGLAYCAHNLVIPSLWETQRAIKRATCRALHAR